MKTLEFEAALGSDSKLKVPPELAAQIPPEEAVRVILLLPEHGSDEDWSGASLEQFLAGYGETDNIYDAL